MGSDSNNLVIDIFKAVGALRCVTIFRQNVGMGWAGDIIERTREFIKIRFPRALHAGLIKGSSDLIGWTTIEIKPEHIGRKIAVFTAIEVKSGSGRSSKEQKIFINNVTAAGGIAGVARSEQDGIDLIENFK